MSDTGRHFPLHTGSRRAADVLLAVVGDERPTWGLVCLSSFTFQRINQCSDLGEGQSVEKLFVQIHMECRGNTQ